MTIIKKYGIPFLLTIIIFGSFGFSPTDCDNGFSSSCMVSSEVISDSCTFKQFHLYGRVQFVESFPDIKIQYVNSFPDLKVQFVESFPDNCGEWKIVESFPDIKVKVVESFPDIKVKIVESFPGKN